MAQVLQLRRGTTAQNDTFTGAVAEVSVDTDRDSLRVHDGTTMGGKEIAPLNVAIPLLADATTVNAADELIVRQGGVVKRATAAELMNNAPVTATSTTTGRSLKDRFAEILNVKDFGAQGDGVADDYAAIMAAYNALPQSGGEIFFPAGTYRFSQPLTFGDGNANQASSKQNISLVGEGNVSGNGAAFLFPTQNRYVVNLIYAGSGSATHAIRFNGPITASICNMSIDGNTLCQYGLYLQHTYFSRYSNLFIYRCIVGIRTFAVATSEVVATGDADNLYHNVHTNNIIQNATTGLDIGNDTFAPFGLCSSRNVFDSCSFVVAEDANSGALVIRGADNNSFRNCMFYVHGQRYGVSIAFIAPQTAGYKHLPYENLFSCVAPIGPMYIDPTWTPNTLNDHANMFFQMNSGDFLDPTKAGSPTQLPYHPGIKGFDSRGYMLGSPVVEGSLGNVVTTGSATIGRVRSDATLANSAALTDLASILIPANTMRQRRLNGFNATWHNDRMLRVTGSFTITNATSGNQNVRIIAKFAGQDLGDVTHLVGNHPTLKRVLRVEAEISTWDNGGKLCGFIKTDLGQAGSSQELVGSGVDQQRIHYFRSSSAFNVSNAHFLVLQTQLETASANLSIQTNNVNAELL